MISHWRLKFSLSKRMLKTARKAVDYLYSDAELVRGFVLTKLNSDGGFQNRAGQSDLYYTLFGLECAAILGCDLPKERIADYLKQFGDGEGLDFIHLCSLVGCWKHLGLGDKKKAEKVAFSLQEYRTKDGGYAADPDAENGTAYGCLMAIKAFQDRQSLFMRDSFRRSVTNLDTSGFSTCLEKLRLKDGSLTNQIGMDQGTTSATAAAVAVMILLGKKEKQGVGWLTQRILPQGGVVANPSIGLPDLLSTGTTLYTLKEAGVDLKPYRQQCHDFVEELLEDDGGFCAHHLDNKSDLEYTFYGLLALGALN